MKPPEKTPQELESDKANELNKQMRTEVEWKPWGLFH